MSIKMEVLHLLGEKRIDNCKKKLDQNYEKYKRYESENAELNKKWKEHVTNNRQYKADRDLQQILYNDDRSMWYRDRSKKLIKNVYDIDPKLGDKLSKKYSPLLDKVFIGDFTLSELESIQKILIN